MLCILLSGRARAAATALSGLALLDLPVTAASTCYRGSHGGSVDSLLGHTVGLVAAVDLLQVLVHRLDGVATGNLLTDVCVGSCWRVADAQTL